MYDLLLLSVQEAVNSV